MPVITAPLLGSINNAVNLAYNTQLFATQTVYQRFTLDMPSSGAAEVYPRLDMLPGIREWVGDRVVQSLSQLSFTIPNRDFEQTISIKRTDIEDDKYGILSIVAQEMGQNAARFPDLLIAKLMLAGHTTATYDGQNFFDTAHPTFDNNGASGPTVANYVTGSGPAWFLFDTKRVVKPLIYQKRKPFVLIPKFSPTDPQVFWNKEFEWGNDGRSAGGFGMWQLGYMSNAALTHDNLIAARTAAASIRRPDGSPMGISYDLLVVPPTYLPAAKALWMNDFQPLAGGATSLLPNQVKGMFEPLENPWIG
jgi:phage major head subunit gpT-like protein